MSTARYDVILLDFFGTLAAGDAQAVHGVCAAVIRDLELSVDITELADAWSQAFFNEMAASNAERFRNIFECECRSLQATVAALGCDLDAEGYVQPLKSYCQNPPLHDEVEEVLASLAVPLCIVSNADDEDLFQAIRATGLQVDGVVTSESARSYKPDHRIFERALELMDVEPQRCLHVGDSRHSDVGGAAAVGLATAWVARDVRIGDLGNAGPEPDYTVRSLLELPAILRNGGPGVAAGRG